MTASRVMFAAVLVLGTPSLLAAQRAPLGPRPSVLFDRPLPLADSLHLAPTHWKEGALIGGIPMGLLGFYVANGLCGGDNGGSHCGFAGLEGAAFGFLIGAIPGALIGGSIPKEK